MSRFTKPVVVVIVLLLFFPVITKTYSQELKNAIKLTKSEQFNKASSMFKTLIAQTPANGDLYFYYGRNLLDKFYADTVYISFSVMADSAKSVFETGIKQDPANPLNFVGLGGLYLSKNDIPKAQAEFASAMALLPSKANKQLKMEPAKQARVLIEMAESYVTANVHDTTSVFPLFRAAEKLDSKNPTLYIVKGDFYFRVLNDGSQGKTNYSLAQALDPRSPEAKLRVGQLCWRAQIYAEAQKNFQEIVKMDSTYAPAYHELGYFMSRTNRFAEAQKNYIKFLELSPENTSARVAYANILFNLKNYPETINQVVTIMKVDSSDNDLFRALAYCYFETQKYDLGLYYIRKFISLAKPEKVGATGFTYYGRLLSKSKQDSLAAEQLMKAYSMDTSKVELISEAAFCYSRMKKFEKSRDLYERRISLNKGAAMDFYNLGKVYFFLQDYIKADTNLASFNSMQPDYLPGWVWHALVKSNIDPDSKLGLAKPLYEIILEKTQSDTAKNSKERIVSYAYLAYYYFLQYNETKSRNNAIKAMAYGIKVIAIDPKDEKAEKARQLNDNLMKNVGVFKLGMTKNDLIKVIGTPSGTAASTANDLKMEILTYDDLKISITINEKGQVDNINFIK